MLGDEPLLLVTFICSSKYLYVCSNFSVTVCIHMFSKVLPPSFNLFPEPALSKPAVNTPVSLVGLFSFLVMP